MKKIRKLENLILVLTLQMLCHLRMDGIFIIYEVEVKIDQLK